ncbi:putative powdery mildew resistance protein, RPW8 [Helianthus annuus]|uniref:Powdery mildew resistance protein, RPW8 n=1 Tax=Helianthus annuus TaxID=4232 RepID=A0A9K3J4V7_HELAN|nr:putative powdery mildew resistance protein, RPW8 [Helianthus annuus]KAJ0924711.1 putative powdery mildew resistance protein, RPW8 [Helianthus annuus]
MGELFGGALLGDAVSKVSTAIIAAIKKTWHFKAQLNEMKECIESMTPIFADMEKLNKELDRRKEETDGFVNLLQQAENLVQKCSHIKLNLWERYSHASKLDALNKSLHTYVQIYLQLQMARDVKEALVVVKDPNRGLQKGSSSGWWSSVPLLKGDVIGFDDRVTDLKDMMFKDSRGDDCSIVVVSAAGGSGKTTFVTLFCHDPYIKGRFGKNIYFVTISRVYDKKVIIKNLLGEVPDNTSDDAAIQQWGSFLAENESEVLLVLDDVWHGNVITDFKFKSPRYKILVTSRITFKQFKTYKLASLDTQDAIHLFCQSASPEQSNIPDELVKKLVKCCKFHPLALTVIGGMLKGTHPARWEVMWKKLSGNNSLLDSDQSILECLEKSLYLFDKEPELKQCYLDLGLFPEDQKIAATALMDIWAHLYKHDDEGSATMDILDRLSSINLATLSPKRYFPNFLVIFN